MLLETKIMSRIGVLPFHGRYSAQTDPQIGGAHGGIHGFMRIVGQDVHIGYIPSVSRARAFREPPAMLRNNYPWIYPVVQLRPLLDAPSRRLDKDPLPVPEALLPRCLGMDLHKGIGPDLSEPRD